MFLIIQLIQYEKQVVTDDRFAVHTIDDPDTFADYDKIIIDLTAEDIWRKNRIFKGDNNFNIDLSSDLHNIAHMIEEYSDKTILLILPENHTLIKYEWKGSDLLLN